jgi:uncharacterized membrane protein YoaK (UPF0700 family)
MLIKEGIERNARADWTLASVLAAVAGALNAAAFYAVGFFSANMTGNVSLASGRIATCQWVMALFYLSIVLAFVFGAAVSTLLISAGRRRHIAGVYAYCILLEAVLLSGLGCADLVLHEPFRTRSLVLGLAFLMGLQNAVVTGISGARVRTTHVSGMSTDIGIELATAFDILRGREPSNNEAHNWRALKLHVCTILSFLAGGVAGVVVYRAVGDYLLIISAGILLLPSLPGIARSRSIRKKNPVK